MPQNIDLEDKIVGPLTLTQFLYVLGGGLIDYILFQSLGQQYFTLFIICGAPIALIALALAFLKIQDQPLSHFITAGLVYLTKPKLRIWKRLDNYQTILTAAPEPVKKEVVEDEGRHLDRSALEQLAYTLDTSNPGQHDTQKHNRFGQVTKAFEQILKEQPAPKAAQGKK